MSVTSIRLQDDLEAPLAELAERSHRSKNWIINQALKEYLENKELAEQRWLETIPALESVRDGKSVPAESVEAWLSSWGTEDEGPLP